MNYRLTSFAAAVVTAGLTLSALAQAPAPGAITVDVDKPGAKASPLLWGIFFEDINLSADGGLYAELVRNRNFEDGDKPDHWSAVSGGKARVEFAVDRSQPISDKNPRSLKVTVAETGGLRVGVANGGYYGISVKRGEAYSLSLWARGGEGFAGPLTVTLEGADRQVHAEGRIAKLSGEWKQYTVSLNAKGTDPKARLTVTTAKPGTFWLDMVSLFPKKTWKNRPNGLRPDLAEMLVGLQPAFNRFPGGCWVEGNTMAEAYRWKQTMGDLSERRTQNNIWGYQATHGIGYHEYLVMCEDLGCEPLFVINCGMSHRENVPMDKMDEFVQDALDAIEYANGPVTSQWGAVRAKNGHPAPFNLKYLEIGNENGGRAYEERYNLMFKAIKTKYPEIRIVANDWAGGPPKNSPLEIVDEHYYNNPEFFMHQASRYDKYDRNGPKIYVGEYAVTQGTGQGNLRGAVGEAAFMTGMERNSDVVTMSSYAPLFVHVNHRRWNPDLINFDSSRVYGIPSYYVQQMFSLNRGDVILPITVESPEVSSGNKAGAVGVGTWLTQAEYKDIKVTRGGETLYAFDPAQGTKGWRLHGGNWSVQDGVLRQGAGGENIRAIIGDRNWSEYTLTLKARKLGGAEGFLILYNVKDDNAKSWWNIGGWGNRQHGVEMGGVVGRQVNGSIETGRWYDIRVELKGNSIKCFLDDKLVHDVSYPAIKALYASATKTKDEVILKMVNASFDPQPAVIKLNGIRKVNGAARATVLTSEKATDENSLDQPQKVAPVAQKLSFTGNTLNHTFPANSVTVLRAKVE